MNDFLPDELPEQLDDWPHDPRAILGVSADANREELRSAYRHRLHRYKPERFPREFQRIRQAYEQLLRWLPPTGSPVDPVTAVPPSFDTPPRTETDSPETADVPDPLGAELARVWEFATSGQPEAAWKELTLLAVASPHEEIVVRRYWLLRVQPSLSTDEVAIDLLYRHLAQQPSSRAVGDLLQAEWERWPPETLSLRCEALLRVSPSGRWLRELLLRRWKTLLQRGVWERLHADVEILHARVDLTPLLRADYWMLGLKLCLTLSSSSRGLADLTQRFQDLLFAEELSGSESRYSVVSHAGAELEQMLYEERQLARQEPSGFQNPTDFSPLMAVIREGVCLCAEQLRLRLCPFLREWAANVAGGLRMLDELCAEYPAHGAELSRLITSLHGRDVPEEQRLSGSELKERLLRDIHFEWRISRPRPRLPFPEWRTGIVQFCIDEAADFDAVVSELHALLPGLPYQSVLSPFHLQTHLATRCVIEGIQLYQAVPTANPTPAAC